MSASESYAQHVNISAHLPQHCAPVDSFLGDFSRAWNVCVPTYLALLSTALGTCSIISWLFAQLPQVYKNYKIRSTAGLSPGFLFIWCLGDTSNLAGALLTGQATWQVIVASYYTFVDCMLVGQYVWYEVMGKGRKGRMLIERSKFGPGHGGRESEERDPLLNSESSHRAYGSQGRSMDAPGSSQTDGGPDGFKFPVLINPPREEKDSRGSSSSGRSAVRVARPTSGAISSPNAILLVACLCIALGRASPVATPSPSLSIRDSHSAGEDPKELAGRIISWASTFLYLISRLPQLFKNYRRKSTAGLSPILFAAAFCGNLFYSSSLLANPLAWASYGPHGHRGWAGPDGSDRAEWVLSATPFFLGAAGVLVLDAAVGIQFLVYGDGRKGKYTPRVPVLIETPPTRGGIMGAGSDAGGSAADHDNAALTVTHSRTLAVPSGGSHAHAAARPAEFEAGSWRRVSGYMRGWVPSFSPASWSYVAAAAATGRSAGDRARSGLASPRSISSGDSAGDVRAEAEVWESRHGTRHGSVNGEDDDRPLLERDNDGR